MTKTILVVEDRLDARYVFAKILTTAGYDVREAASGADALRLAATLRPAVIVLDIVLPDMDGFEVLRRLKADDATRGIPVIHKTAVYRDEQYRARSLAAGAEECLMEPIEREILVAAVRRLAQA
jgi:CheY-like chemotaxis protein